MIVKLAEEEVDIRELKAGRVVFYYPDDEDYMIAGHIESFEFGEAGLESIIVRCSFGLYRNFIHPEKIYL